MRGEHVLFGCSFSGFGRSRNLFSSGLFSGRSFFSGRCSVAALFFKLEVASVDDACSSGYGSLEDTSDTYKLQLHGSSRAASAATPCCVQCLAFEDDGL